MFLQETEMSFSICEFSDITVKDCAKLESTSFNILKYKPFYLLHWTLISSLLATPGLQTIIKSTELKKEITEDNKNQSKKPCIPDAVSIP